VEEMMLNYAVGTRDRINWKLPGALLALSVVPVAAGTVRLVGLVRGGPISPENMRFFAAPVPISLHILSAILFCILGAAQFSAQLRRLFPRSHRLAGRIASPCGIVAGLSGVWMTATYPLYPHLQGALLYGFRIAFGLAMVVAISLALSAIRRRDIASHRDWMIRAYAIGQGAGTQVLITVPFILVLGGVSGLIRDLLMCAGWLINVAVAEWIVRRRR
jgi:uncharacterized membrane protein